MQAFRLIVILSFLGLAQCGSLQGQPANTDPSVGEKGFAIVSQTETPIHDNNLPTMITINPEFGSLSFSYETGEILNDQAKAGLCLNRSKLLEVQHILEDSSICETEYKVPEDLMCTLIYTLPYMTIHLQDKSFLLGRKESGCPKKTTDLCHSSISLKKVVNQINRDADFVACKE